MLRGIARKSRGMPVAEPRAVTKRPLLGLGLAMGLAGASLGCDGSLGDPAGPTGPHTPPSAIASVTGARRLSSAELDNTVRDLFGDTTRPATRLLGEDEFAPYDNDYTLQRASRTLIESIEVMANDVGDRVSTDPALRARIVPCTPSGDSDAACYRMFVEQMLARALRRPVTAEDVDPYMPLLDFATEDATNPYVTTDFYTSVGLAIRAVLQDPEFLYRIEVGAPTAEPTVFALGGHEIATRMAYLLWGTTPDPELLADAASGRLETTDGRRVVAERMLDDDRARDQVHRFHAMWLGYRSIPHGPELTAAFGTETNALIDRVVFEEDRDYADLFTLEETYVDPMLASHYGLPAVDAAGWAPYPADSGRAGILAHGSVLAAFSKFTDTSPTQRGILVRSRLMCDFIAPPPPTVNVDAPPGEGTDAVCKSERYALHRDQSTSCAGCHAQMDPIGFGLERFDVAGRYREHDDGYPDCAIDGVGELPGVGPFSGPAELGTLLVEQGEIDDCVVRQLWEFAQGREITDAEATAIAGTVEGFREGGRSMRGLLVEMVASPRFALRQEEM